MINSKIKKNIFYDEVGPYEGKFIIRPLSPGFGVTYGNLYRRVLLSSICGVAICAVKINGVDHMYSSIDGVVESVLDILLNLKQVRLKKKKGKIDDNGEIVSVNFSKKEVFLANDIGAATDSYEVSNPDFIICRMSPEVSLNIDLKITEGVGYTESKDHDPSLIEKNFLPIDCIFSPVVNSFFKVENDRFKDKVDFDKLTLTIKTDGTASPLDLLHQASEILKEDILNIYNFENSMGEGAKEVDEVDTLSPEYLSKKSKLRVSLKDYLDKGLSQRSINCLLGAGITTVGDLLNSSRAEVQKLKNFGNKSLEEVIKFVDGLKGSEDSQW